MASPEEHHRLWVARPTPGAPRSCLTAQGAAARPAHSRPRLPVITQVLCFLGSLFEPFDTVLPAKHPLRFFVDQVQHARRAFEVKHGLEGLRSPMNFFDETDDEVDDAEEDGDGDGDGDGEDAEEQAEEVAAAGSVAPESSEE